MGKLVTFLALVFLISGCAATPDGQRRAFDNEVHVVNSGEKWTVNSLKQDYKNKTGNDLVVTGTLECGWDSDCYYNKWSDAHDIGISELDQKNAMEAIKKEKQCRADVKCMKNREIDSAINNLNYSYRVVMAQNPYFQSDFDAAVRQVCRKAGVAQRNGVSQDEMNRNLDSVEGIAPQDRIMIKRVASSCWTLSNNGIADGTTKIFIG